MEKYEIVQIYFGEEHVVCRTDDILEAQRAYRRAVLSGGGARLKLEGKTLPIYKAERLLLPDRPCAAD